MKALYLGASLIISSCAGYKQKIIATQREISYVWNRAWEIVVPDGSCIMSSCDHESQVNRQDEYNSCYRAAVQMLFNTYWWHNFTEEQISQEYQKLYPLSNWMVNNLFHGQNPQIGRITDFINHYISHYQAIKTKKDLTPGFLLSLCEQWWSIMITIHSRLGYPHRVIVNGCYYDDAGDVVVQFSNPSSTIQDRKWNPIGYRHRSIERDQIVLWDDPVINTMKFEDFMLLHTQTLFTYPRPISDHHIWYIVVSPQKI